MKDLDVRKQLRKKRPTFVRADAHKHKEVKPRWRKPRGLHNKMRHAFAGHRKKVQVGYRSPRSVRGRDPEGRIIIHVSSSTELAKVKKEDGVVLAAGLGMRKRATLIAEANNKGLTILNIDQKTYQKRVEEQLAARKEAKKKQGAKKVKEKPKKEAKKEEKPEKDKDQEKKELDKLLTKK